MKRKQGYGKGVVMGPFDLMENLREQGWCVVLKVLPKELGWIIEGSRSEYDAPCPDQVIGKGKWCAEAHWVGEGGYRHRQSIMGDSPDETMKKLWCAIADDEHWRKERERQSAGLMQTAKGFL